MSDANRDWNGFDPEAREEREIGREMVSKSTGLGSVVARFLSRGNEPRDRVAAATRRDDQLGSDDPFDNPHLRFFSTEGTHVILVAGMGVVTMFLGIEVRRYQDYDVYRARARLLQENWFANALDPSPGAEHRDWRRELNDDYRDLSIKVPSMEALARRFQRIYLPMFFLLLAAWLFELMAFGSGQAWLDDAAVGNVPGVIVVSVVALFYVAAVAIAFWPRERRAKGEFDEAEHGEWKETD